MVDAILTDARRFAVELPRPATEIRELFTALAAFHPLAETLNTWSART
jgi:hypothetical protein